MPARSGSLGPERERPAFKKTRASKGSGPPIPLQTATWIQLHRRAGGTAGKTSVTRELPVCEAVKLRQLSLTPPSRAERRNVRTTLLFTMSANRQPAPSEPLQNLHSYDKHFVRLALLLQLRYDSLRRVAKGTPGRSRGAAKAGGARRDRTDDLLLAKQALSQLSYGPVREPSAVRPLGSLTPAVASAKAGPSAGPPAPFGFRRTLAAPGAARGSSQASPFGLRRAVSLASAGVDWWA